jgi:hypothetical protein
MTQQAPPGSEEAVSYMKHQAGKGTDSLVALIQRCAADWQRALAGISEAQASFAPQGEWNAKEVLVHFLDATHHLNRQIGRVLQGKDPLPDDGGGAGHKPEDARSLAELSDDVAQLFDETVALTRRLEGNPHLETHFRHPFFGQLNILEWTAFQRIHTVDHVNQVEAIKNDPAYPKA